MVTAGIRGTAGKSRLGCLLFLLFLALAGYYGVDAGQGLLLYWQMRDEMNTQAQFAMNMDDATIRRRLVAKARELHLPRSAEKIIIRRRAHEIEIITSWPDTLMLPFTHYVVTYRPDVRSEL